MYFCFYFKCITLLLSLAVLFMCFGNNIDNDDKHFYKNVIILSSYMKKSLRKIQRQQVCHILTKDASHKFQVDKKMF